MGTNDFRDKEKTLSFRPLTLGKDSVFFQVTFAGDGQVHNTRQLRKHILVFTSSSPFGQFKELPAHFTIPIKRQLTSASQSIRSVQPLPSRRHIPQRLHQMCCSHHSTGAHCRWDNIWRLLGRGALQAWDGRRPGSLWGY